MRPSPITALLVLTLLAPAIAGPREARASRLGRAAEAESLYQRAEGMLQRNTVETRRLAIGYLEQATLLEPATPLYQLTLARAYYRAGFLKSARQRFERVARMNPQDAPSRYGLGQVWRRDWLKYLDDRSLHLAVQHLSAAARLEPAAADAWLLLTPLLVEQDDLGAAAAAAARAFEADADRPECALAVAYTAYRRGEVEHADQAFRGAIPRLPEIARRRFEDIAPVASEQDTARLRRLLPAEQRAFVQRFWREHDPDPTTPENEALLEYWSRVTHAFFLFFDLRRREWDERGEVYVRYGRPGRAEYNPVGAPLSMRFGTGPDFPANLLVWDYPELGMKVTMQDRLLSEYYVLPITRTHDPDPQPDPDSLARRTDALASAGGRGVFPVLPPGVRPMPVEGVVARFEGPEGPRVLAMIEAVGSPGDSLIAEWTVIDSAGAEKARARRPLSPSACEPTVRRTAEFATALPPGAYRVGLSVRDARGRRGVHRETVALAAPPRGLALSDVVISCGPPDLSAGPAVRIAANPSARVATGDPLTAYFEIYRLLPGRDRQSRFEYVYTVRSTARDERIWLKRAFAPRAAPEPLQATREEAFMGDLRRQFVTVPVQSLPPGPYRLEIQVRDLVSGEMVRGTADFVREQPTASVP
jgi:GWxTD domain-containing protein